MAQFFLYVNSKSANFVSVVLCIFPFRKIPEHMLSHKYAVQSFIAVGSQYMPYVFLKDWIFKFDPVTYYSNKYLVHRCQCQQVISEEGRFPCKYVLLGKKIDLILLVACYEVFQILWYLIFS